MRVLVATPYLFPQGGGLERYAHAISVELATGGHEVIELGHADAGRQRAWGPRREVGVPPGLRLSNTPLSLRYHREAKRLLRDGRIDVAFVHTPVPGAAEMAAHAARRARVPYVVAYHAGRLAAPKGSPLALAAWVHRASFERAMLANAAGRVAVSSYVADHVFAGRECAIVPPGVDAERFSPGATEIEGRILYVGPVDRAYAWKGFATLFGAFLSLAPAHPEAHLRVVGGGNLVDEYRERARAAGLADRVAFAGRVEDAGLVDEYRRASLLVLPSVSDAESFGMVLAEANACGRPVVGSRVGGIPCFVEDGVNGLLATPGDAADLAGKIGALLADARLRARLGAAGRRKVLEAHRWPALAKETEAVLTAACARAPRRSSP